MGKVWMNSAPMPYSFHVLWDNITVTEAGSTEQATRRVIERSIGLGDVQALYLQRQILGP